MAHLDLTACVERPEPSCRNTLVGATGECVTRSHHEMAIEHGSLAIPESPGEELRVPRARQRGSTRHRRNGRPTSLPPVSTETVAATTGGGTLSGVPGDADEQGDSTYELH